MAKMGDSNVVEHLIACEHFQKQCLLLFLSKKETFKLFLFSDFCVS